MMNDSTVVDSINSCVCARCGKDTTFSNLRKISYDGDKYSPDLEYQLCEICYDKLIVIWSRPSLNDDKIELFLRVKKEYQDVVFEVKSGEKVIKTIKKRHLAPAEMEQVVLSSKLLETLNIKDSISVEVIQ